MLRGPCCCYNSGRDTVHGLPAIHTKHSNCCVIVESYIFISFNSSCKGDVLPHVNAAFVDADATATVGCLLVATVHKHHTVGRIRHFQAHARQTQNISPELHRLSSPASTSAADTAAVGVLPAACWGVARYYVLASSSNCIR